MYTHTYIYIYIYIYTHMCIYIYIYAYSEWTGTRVRLNACSALCSARPACSAAALQYKRKLYNGAKHTNT